MKKKIKLYPFLYASPRMFVVYLLVSCCCYCCVSVFTWAEWINWNCMEYKLFGFIHVQKIFVIVHSQITELHTFFCGSCVCLSIPMPLLLPSACSTFSYSYLSNNVVYYCRMSFHTVLYIFWGADFVLWLFCYS